MHFFCVITSKLSLTCLVFPFMFCFSLSELVKHEENGLIFEDSTELSQNIQVRRQLFCLLKKKSFPNMIYFINPPPHTHTRTDMSGSQLKNQ